MNTIPRQILTCLEKQPLKPSVLAKKLGISRQALHTHLRGLLAAKNIRKHGVAPHVLYSVAMQPTATTRVHSDYLLCEAKLRTKYLKSYATRIQRCFERRPAKKGEAIRKPNLEFLLASAAVYSSNIEGNTLDLSSFLNSRMSPKHHRPREAEEIEDLMSAYEWTRTHDLSEHNILRAHKILSNQFVAPTRQGRYRKEPVGVFSRSGLVYMAIEPEFIADEMHTLLTIVGDLLRKQQSPAERLFWASWLHLMIALIHPFSDGNGRTARLCEKWFLATTLGEHAFDIPTEEQYWLHRPAYYASLRLGANYWETDLKLASPFFALLPDALLARGKGPSRKLTS